MINVRISAMIKRRMMYLKPKVFEKEYRVPYYLSDRYETITLPNLMSVLIEVSGEQTQIVMKHPVEEQGLHWIIIQYDIQVNRMPKANETIQIKTFAKEFNRLFSYREFEVYDEEGNLLVYVMTVFALMDDNRKLSRIPAEIGKGYGSEETRRIKRMPKPEAIQNIDKANRKDFSVSYFDIDINFHANNANYFLWMLDALGDEFLATHYPTEGNVVFEKEIKIGEEVESYVEFNVDENDTLISKHRVQVGNIVKCTASFKWKENGHKYQL